MYRYLMHIMYFKTPIQLLAMTVNNNLLNIAMYSTPHYDFNL